MCIAVYMVLIHKAKTLLTIVLIVLGHFIQNDVRVYQHA